MQSIKVYIPMLPPSVNDCYKRNKWGGLRMSKDGVDYKRIVSFKIKRDGIVFLPVKKMYLEIEFHSSQWLTKKKEVAKKDIDNLLKVSIDALMDALGIDDKNIFQLSVKKVISESPMVVYSLFEMEP